MLGIILANYYCRTYDIESWSCVLHGLFRWKSGVVRRFVRAQTQHYLRRVESTNQRMIFHSPNQCTFLLYFGSHSYGYWDSVSSLSAVYAFVVRHCYFLRFSIVQLNSLLPLDRLTGVTSFCSVFFLCDLFYFCNACSGFSFPPNVITLTRTFSTLSLSLFASVLLVLHSQTDKPTHSYLCELILIDGTRFQQLLSGKNG